MEHRKENLPNEIQEQENKEQKKKLYASPKLKSYGDVVKLTQGSSGSISESGTFHK